MFHTFGVPNTHHLCNSSLPRSKQRTGANEFEATMDHVGMVCEDLNGDWIGQDDGVKDVYHLPDNTEDVLRIGLYAGWIGT